MGKDILELRADWEHKVRSAEDISNRAEKEDRLLTKEDENHINGFLKEAKDLEDEIKALEEQDALKNKLKGELSKVRQPGARVTPPQQPNETPSAGKSRVEVVSGRYSTLKAFKGPNAELNAYVSGQWLRANFLGDYKASRWCREHGYDVRTIHAAQGENVNTAGGNLVPEEFANTIITLRETYGVFRRECKVTPMGRDLMHIPRRAGGLTAYWVAENPATGITESDKVWDQVQLIAKKLGILTLMSTEIAEDAIINLADDIADEMAYTFAKTEDTAGFSGDGTSTYGGITGVLTKFNNNTSYKGAVAAASGHNKFSDFTYTDVTSMMAALPQYAHEGAKFYCSQAFFDATFSRLAVTAGGNTNQTVTGEYKPSFSGYEIVTSQVFPLDPTVSNASKAVCLFGRLDKAALMGERRGIQVMRSDDRYFELDQIGLKATERIDINVHDVGDTSGAGPIVALMGTT
jgi:HK97 family phage major capsid protein